MGNRVKAYSYIRMSTARQLKGDSLRRQLQQSIDYARERDFELIDDFDLRDIGVSAFTGENAKVGALRRFLDLVEQGKIEPGSYLLVESLDRISRQRIIDSQPIFAQIIGAGINIVTLIDNHEYPAYTNDIGHFMYSLMAFARANDESRTKSERIGKSWQRKRDIVGQKKLTSWCPFWLKLDPQTQQFIGIPDRVETVRRIFNECAAGIGIYAITRRLNESNVPPFGAKSWHTSYINKILNNRSVLGEFQPHKRDKDNRRIPDGPLIQNYFPAIISEDLYLRCQSGRSSRSSKNLAGKGRKGKTLSNLFSSMAKCAYCGGTIRYENKGDGPKGGRYLICEPSTRKAFGCPALRWRYADFESTFLTFVREVGLNELVGPDENKRDGLIERIQTLQGKEEQLVRQRSGIIDMIPLVENKATLASEYDKVENAIKETQNSIHDLRREIADLSARSHDFYEGREQIKELLQTFEIASESDLYKLRATISTRIRALVEEIIIGSLGSQPVVAGMLAQERNSKKPNRQKIRDLEENLWAPATVQRYISIRFKDGSIRVLLPNRDDPFHMDVYGQGPSMNQMVKYHADGNKTPMSAATTDVADWYDSTLDSNQA